MKCIPIITGVLVFFCFLNAGAQVGIGIVTPDSSAQLHVFSTAKGFLPPVHSQIQRDAILKPADGLMVYCKDCTPKGYYLYTNGQWESLMNTDKQAISRSGLTVTLESGGSYQDSILSESDVDAMVSDNGYLTSFTEVDGSTSNELQNISRSGLTVTLESGGSYQDSILSESDVDAMVSDNGYLTSFTEVDGSTSNELQNISRSGLTVTLESGGSYQDSILSESDVDAMVSDNGYLTSFTEVDGSTSNELQNISRSGLTVTLESGGSYQDSILSESDVDAMVSDNGYLTSFTEVDGSISNELQNISRSGLTVTLESGGSYQDSILSESDVDAMVSNNGYLTSFTEVDGSTSNELQNISRSGLTVTLESGGSYQDSILSESDVDAMVSNNGYLTSFTEVDGSTSNELQNISRSGLTVTLENGGSYQDSILSESGVDAMVSNNGYLTSFTEVDGSTSNELQNISRSGLTVTLESGGSYQDSILSESDVDAMVSDNGYLTSFTEVDGSTSNELQNISRSGLTVTLESGGSYQDSILSESDVDAMVSNNGYLTSFTEVDGSISNELQSISKSGSIVTLSNSGGSFTDDVLTENEVDSYVSNNGYLTNTIDIDGTLSANSDVSIPSQKAVKTYVDNNTSAGLVAHASYTSNISGNTGNFVSASMSSSAIHNLGLGQNTLAAVTTSQGNVAVGNYSLDVATSGGNNTAIGAFSLSSVSTGSDNTAIGRDALENTTGSYNVAIGSLALESITSASYSIGIGYLAGQFASGGSNIFIGRQSGQSESRSQTLYIENSGASQALIGGTFDYDRVGINRTITDIIATDATFQVGGNMSVENGTVINEFSIDGTLSGNSNDALPTEASVKDYVDNYATKLIATSLGSRNYHANLNNMPAVTSAAANNMALGYTALNDLTSGDANIGMGYYSLNKLTSGFNNVAIGYQSLFYNETGSYNVALGRDAGIDIKGSSNTIIGDESGENTTGGSNTFLGRRSGYNSQSDRSVFLGYYAGYYEDRADMLYIENSSSDQPLIGGSFAHDVVTINTDYSGFDFSAHATTKDYNLFISGGAYKSTGGSTWNHSSDRRLKTDIEYMKAEEMLDKVLRMKGVSYVWNDTVTGLLRDDGIQYGFIAQDLQKVWPEKILDDPFGYLATSYGPYDAMFVESIRALYNHINQLEEENKNLKVQNNQQNNQQQLEIDALKTELEEIKAFLKPNNKQVQALAK